MEPDILNLPREQFLAALDELQLDPARRDDLVRQYRRANSPFAPIYGLLDRVAAEDAGQGMQRAAMLPVSRPEGMSVAEALRSGEAQFAVPQGLFDAVSALAGGVDAPAAAALGLIPEQDMAAEALGTAGVAMGAGGLLARPAGSVGMGGRVAPDARAAETPNMRLWHGSPYDFRQFDMGRIGTGEGAQDLGRGFSLSDDQAQAMLYTNPASRWGDLAAMERYRQMGPGRYYAVDVGASQNQFLDWKLPWRDQVPEGTPLYDLFLQRERDYLNQYADDPAMQEAIPRAKVSNFWTDDAGFEDAALQSGFVGNSRRNYSGDTEYTVFDPSILNIVERFDANGNELSANRSTTAGLLASAAETPAQRVARLLREGRASEVTDDLMAQADPQEMYRLYVAGETGADMPMDEASRMVRAREMGFDTGLYHETSSDFPAFDVTRQGAGRGDSEMPTGVFAKPQGGSIGLGGDTETQMPLLARTGRNLQVPDRIGMRMEVGALNPDYTAAWLRADDYDSAMSRAWDQRFEGDAGQSWLNQNPDEYFAEADRTLAGWNTRNVELGQDARNILDNALRAAGYDSATVLRDEGFLGRQTPTTVIFDPTNIRSRFARFDPRLSHLANLNAANVDPITGLLAMMQAQEQQQ